MSTFDSRMRQNRIANLSSPKTPDLVTKSQKDPNSEYKMDTILQIARVIDVIQFQIFKNIFFRDCHAFVFY